MPNWCANVLEISSGDDQVIASFREQARAEGTDLSLGVFLPTPQRLIDTPASSTPHDLTERTEYDRVRASNICEYGSADWYDWAIENWGTKWDVQATLAESRQHYIKYEFESAWSPPLRWLRTASIRFTDALFFLSFSEFDTRLCGNALAQAGVIIAHSIESEIDYWDDWDEGEGGAVTE